jgi:hypothetical protein
VRRPLYGHEITHYHRPISTYIRALLDAGFLVERVGEVTGRDDEQPIPMFLHTASVKGRS